VAEQPGAAAAEYPGAPLRVVLVTPRNPLNIGAAARAMSNFGFTRLRLVNPYDAAFREARSAIKSKYVLEQAQIFDNLAEAVADCTLVVGTTAVGHRDLRVPLYRLETAGALIREHLANSASALLFGSEKFGLSNEDMSHCHWLMHIPTREEHFSMNLGQAVAICLYELIRDSAAPLEPGQGTPATGAEVERIYETLLVALEASGYPKLNSSETFQAAVRRMVYRLRLHSGDAEFFLGMLRQMVWKLKRIGGALKDAD